LSIFRYLFNQANQLKHKNILLIQFLFDTFYLGLHYKAATHLHQIKDIFNANKELSFLVKCLKIHSLRVRFFMLIHAF
jgi:hypothetical protein